MSSAVSRPERPAASSERSGWAPGRRTTTSVSRGAEEQVGVLRAERGQTGVRAAGGIRRRGDARGHDGGDLVGAVQAAQHVGTERHQVHPGKGREAHHLGGRAGEEHLTGPGELADASGPVQCRTEAGGCMTESA